MACGSCGSGSCGTPAGCGSNGSCGSGGCNKLNVFDWLSNMHDPSGLASFPYVEVRFKNSRKDFFHNVNNLALAQGEVVAVESSPGHDIGVVSLTGELVKVQMKKRAVEQGSEEIKKLYRKAKEQDIEKWVSARELEEPTMHKARKIAVNLNLQMKISDVEYQGDKTKATFYYTADERVDFRELIKILASEFKVRIEMRQIGSRQEAGRLGGIGSCGRELCCSTWLTDFRTVNTSAARYQQLSLNPVKLAGQCGKLKCCLNYELDAYVEAYKEFPDSEIILQTEKGNAKHQKTDIFRRKMWYAYEHDFSKFHMLNIDKVKEIIDLNKQGVKPAELEAMVATEVLIEKLPDYENVVGQDSLDRFDKKIRDNKNKKKKRNQNNRKPQVQQNAVTGDNPKISNSSGPNKSQTGQKKPDSSSKPKHNHRRNHNPNQQRKPKDNNTGGNV
jgi:cell fate regulator YaaT (PSP1 superfamily)